MDSSLQPVGDHGQALHLVWGAGHGHAGCKTRVPGRASSRGGRVCAEWAAPSVVSSAIVCGPPEGGRGSAPSTPGLWAESTGTVTPRACHWAAAGCLQPDNSLFSLQIGHIEGQPERKGVFPVSFVHILSD